MAAVWQSQGNVPNGAYWGGQPQYTHQTMHPSQQQQNMSHCDPIVIQPVNAPQNHDYQGQNTHYGDPPPGYMDPHITQATIDPHSHPMSGVGADPSYHCVNQYTNIPQSQPALPQYTTATEADAPVTYATPTITSTLTPTTLDQVIGQRAQSGFVPPVVSQTQEGADMTKFAYYRVDEGDPDWSPSPKRLRVSEPTGTNPPPRRQGGRRPMDTTGLSEEEIEKKKVRRERNKLAAAKCRQRRVDHTNVLINKTEVLEEEKSTLENEISSLQQQKEQLEFLLKAHRPLCDKGVQDDVLSHRHGDHCCGITTATTVPTTTAETRYTAAQESAIPLVIKQEAYEDDESSLCSSDSMPADPAGAAQAIGYVSTNANHVTYTATATSIPVSTATSSTGRPSSLPIIRPTDVSLARVPITTPSKVVGVHTIGLDSLMDGHTGLTPLTGVSSSHTGLTPGHTGFTPGHSSSLIPCSTAHRNSSDSSSNEGLNSPTLLKL